MVWTHLLSYFFGGAFLANAMPHLVAGMMGRPFQSPFAKPPGQGLSSSTVNVLWGFLNLVLGYVLVCRVGDSICNLHPTSRRWDLACLLLSLFQARQFGRFNGGNRPEQR